MTDIPMRGWLTLLIAAAVAVVAGFAVATWSDSPIIDVGRADTSANGDGSISTDDWTYGFPRDVHWIGMDGSWHQNGPAECLQPGGSVTVRFAAVEVTVEGATWRPVVWVDCRTVSAP